jgi:hypothetical protein
MIFTQELINRLQYLQDTILEYKRECEYYNYPNMNYNINIKTELDNLYQQLSNTINTLIEN